jgi:Ankyrin repeats (3 copies)
MVVETRRSKKTNLDAKQEANKTQKLINEDAFDYAKTYFKFTNKHEKHYGFQYKDGLNTDTIAFDDNPESPWSKGGLYFADLKYIMKFIDYGIQIREVKVPENEKVIKQDNKYRAHSIILGKKWDVLDFIKHFDITFTNWDSAALNGFLEIVKWLHSNRTEGCTKNSMDFAAMNGHLEIVKFLHLNRTEGCTTYAMNWATQSGHLDVVQWLHCNRTEGCTSRAMDYAAERGHLEVVKWLHCNRTEGCTANAMDFAAGGGHLDVVKFLHLNRTEGCTTNAMDHAARYGRLDVVEFLTSIQN